LQLATVQPISQKLKGSPIRATLSLQNHPQISAADYRALAVEEVLKETRA